ncbi:hypothetical protein J6590_036571 [Homalodisca vitripennis]|nr:hypothetical protein J6590_036571 [Homalodisca vitripennis]
MSIFARSCAVAMSCQSHADDTIGFRKEHSTRLNRGKLLSRLVLASQQPRVLAQVLNNTAAPRRCINNRGIVNREWQENYFAHTGG